jgi:hypothetical protein
VKTLTSSSVSVYMGTPIETSESVAPGTSSRRTTLGGSDKSCYGLLVGPSEACGDTWQRPPLGGGAGSGPLNHSGWSPLLNWQYDNPSPCLGMAWADTDNAA